MTFGKRAAIVAAGLVAVYAAGVPARADSLPPSLRSFGESRAISAYELSAAGVAGFTLQPPVTPLWLKEVQANLHKHLAHITAKRWNDRAPDMNYYHEHACEASVLADAFMAALPAEFRNVNF